MADEPEPLGERLRRMESSIAMLTGDMAHARASERMFDTVWEHVLMPSILLLSGQGRRHEIEAMLLRAEEEVRSDQHVFEPLREANADALAGWREWLAAKPEWSPPSFPDRHPDLYL